MISNRQYGQQQTTETSEHSGLRYADFSARNEHIQEPVTTDKVEDFNSLLYHDPSKTDTVVKTVPAPKAIYDEDELTPTSTTMQHRSQGEQMHNPYAYRGMDLYESEPFRDEDRQYKVNSKGKALIAVYAIVVLTIFALIVLNTRLLNSMNGDVAMMEERVQILQEQNYDLEQELSFVSSDNEIERKAIEMGMTK